MAAADKGIEYINSAIEKVPNNGTVYRIKGEILLAKNDGNPSEEMAAAYEKMFELYNAHPANREKFKSSYRAADYLLGIYYSDKDKAKAREYLADYLTISPDDESVKALYDSLAD